MDKTLQSKLASGAITREDVLAILEWQLSLPAEQMDCALISECDLYLSPDGSRLSREREDALYARLLARIAAGDVPAPDRRTPARQRRAGHRRPVRRLTLIALIAVLLLALAVGGVAYGYRRGVLNFTEDFGFAKMVSQEGAEQFVSSGTLAHLSLEHVDVDVLEAAYDGAELRVVYALTSHDGELKLAPYMANGYVMPGSEEGEVHVCDYLRVNGQDAYFDDAWEMPGDAPGQMLYYLQTNLSQWGVDVADAETLTLGLPLLAKDDPDSRVQPTLDFTIPAAIPEGLVRTAEVTEADMGGLRVTVAEARFSPLNGYVQLRIEGLTQERFYAEFSTLCEVYAMDGSLLTSSHIAGSHFDDEGALIGVTMAPTEGQWPDQMIVALEFTDYSPDWEAVLTLSPAKN